MSASRQMMAARDGDFALPPSHAAILCRHKTQNSVSGGATHSRCPRFPGTADPWSSVP
ncbi:hypothetical protein [Citrobacter sp. CtB7.12]|uniref:hypothetical protein n=1 Tax=Citrobacter sp. CtB7.12 TaxID=1696093 RepID=UPI000A79C128|nr:hypothetical protein [Citrobacter sp. CtB7.12]